MKYCVPETLSLEALAKVRLPGPVTNLDLYREFFAFESDFRACVRALRDAGKLPKRSDETFRLWDAYTIVAAVVHATRTSVGEGFAARPAFAPDVFLAELDEEWWAAVIALAAGREAIRSMLTNPVVVDPTTGEHRIVGEEERAREAEKIVPVVADEERELAASLPSEPAWWKTRLRAHAMLVLRLRQSACVGLARLASYHLSAATELAALRLGVTRRKLRELVGVVNGDLTMPALTAASFSMPTRVRDQALDLLESMLPEYNTAAVADLRLSPADLEEFVDHLEQAGLGDWMVQLVTETWDAELLWRMDYDQRVATVYGRVRTMCTLLEEAIQSFAELTNDAAFASRVESQETMAPRLTTFLDGPTDKTSPVTAAAVQALKKQYQVHPPISSADLEACFNGLDMSTGNLAPPPAPDSAKVLAGLIFVRNLTNHRYPIVLADQRAAWFVTWGDHLPAVNRTVAWAALTLWALAKHFR